MTELGENQRTLQAPATPAKHVPTGTASSTENGGSVTANAPFGAAHFTPQRAPGELDFDSPGIRELGRRGLVKSLSQKFREGSGEDVRGGSGAASRSGSVEDLKGESGGSLSRSSSGRSEAVGSFEAVGSPRFSRLANKLKGLNGESRFG